MQRFMNHLPHGVRFRCHWDPWRGPAGMAVFIDTQNNRRFELEARALDEPDGFAREEIVDHLEVERAVAVGLLKEISRQRELATKTNSVLLRLAGALELPVDGVNWLAVERLLWDTVHPAKDQKAEEAA